MSLILESIYLIENFLYNNTGNNVTLLVNFVNRTLTNDNVEQIDTDLDNYSFAIVNFWPGQFILIFLYTLTAFLSLTLNIITIMVWYYGKRSKEIWHLLINLSLADIGMALFCIPFTYTNVMLRQWIFPHLLCPLINFAQLCFVFVNVWTLTIISIDR